MVAVVTTRLVVPAALRLHQEMRRGSEKSQHEIQTKGGAELTDGREEVSDVVAGHEGAGVGVGDLGETEGTGDGEESDDGEDGPPHLDAVGDVDGEEKSDDTDTASGHLHEDGGESVETEALGDKTAEGTDTTRGAGGAEPHAGPHVGLGVLVGLPELLPLPLGGLGAGVVLPEALDGDESVVTLAEEAGGGGRVGQEPSDEGNEGERDGADEDEDALVRPEDVAVADGFADGVREKGADDGGARVGDLVGDRAVRLLSAEPPHLGDQDERGQDSRLEHAEEKTGDDETGEVLRGGRAEGDDGPGGKVEAGKMSAGQDLRPGSRPLT
jgi:hypothetical protein